MKNIEDKREYILSEFIFEMLILMLLSIYPFIGLYNKGEIKIIVAMIIIVITYSFGKSYYKFKVYNKHFTQCKGKIDTLPKFLRYIECISVGLAISGVTMQSKLSIFRNSLNVIGVYLIEALLIALIFYRLMFAITMIKNSFCKEK